MKTAKIASFIAILVAGLTFASCKKNYSCECTIPDAQTPTSTKTNTNYGPLSKKEGADAELACNSEEAEAKKIDNRSSCDFVIE